MPCDSNSYRFQVKGHLDRRWLAWMDMVTVAHEADGTTVITVHNVDQAMLHGILERIRDTGALLLSVHCLDADDVDVDDVDADS